MGTPDCLRSAHRRPGKFRVREIVARETGGEKKNAARPHVGSRLDKRKFLIASPWQRRFSPRTKNNGGLFHCFPSMTNFEAAIFNYHTPPGRPPGPGRYFFRDISMTLSTRGLDLFTLFA